MASSLLPPATVNGASPAQASKMAPFTGLKSTAGLLMTRNTNDITSIASNGGRVECMLVSPPHNIDFVFIYIEIDSF